jgi:hypothetical protein
MMDPQPGPDAGLAREQLRLDRITQTNQNQVRILALSKKSQCRRNRDVRAMVPAHAVDGNADVHLPRC